MSNGNYNTKRFSTGNLATGGKPTCFNNGAKQIRVLKQGPETGEWVAEHEFSSMTLSGSLKHEHSLVRPSGARPRL